MNKKIPQLKAVVSLREVLESSININRFELARIENFMDDNFVNFGTAAMYLKAVTPEQIGKVLKEKYSVYTVNPEEVPVQSRIRGLVPVEKVKSWQVYPLTVIDDSGQKVILLGMTDPLDTAVIRKFESITQFKVQPAFISLDDLQLLFRKYYKIGFDFLPPEITCYGEKTAKRRIDAVVSNKKKPIIQESPLQKVTPNNLLRALIQTLVDKELITWKDIEEQMS